MHLRHLPHVSELERYKLSRFSRERLLHYITITLPILPRRAIKCSALNS